MRDYQLAGIMSYAVNDPKHFPSFSKFYPEQRPDGQVRKAIKTAKLLGDL